MIDAAEVSYNVEGNTGSSDYTTVAYVTGAGKGATITPVNGDTGKRLFFINAGERTPEGIHQHHGTHGYFLSVTSNDATSVWRFCFSGGYTSGTMMGANKLWAYSLRCVRS